MLSWKALSKRTQAPCREILSSHRPCAHVKKLADKPQEAEEAVAKQIQIRLRGEQQHTLVVEMIPIRRLRVARRVCELIMDKLRKLGNKRRKLSASRPEETMIR